MAHTRPSYPSLEGASAEGLVLRAIVQGDSVAAKNGSLAFAFRDSSGNAILPQLTADGRLPVSLAAAGTCVKDSDKVAGSGSVVTVAEISLTAGELYKDIDWTASCFRDAEFELVAINDPAGTPTEQHLGWLLVGPGQFTADVSHSCMEFTAGATAPVLRVRAKNINSTSDLSSIITALEVA